MEKVVECRFFGGMNVAETAEVLGISIRAVERDWQHARLYLMRLLDGSEAGLASNAGEV
jgi:DNA-directed RNA polymerase specialized sigma24 family protein